MNTHGVSMHKEKRGRETHWFVYLHEDPRANQIVSQALCEPDCTERLHAHKPCSDGKARNLYELTHQESLMVRKAGKEFNFSVTIFVQENRLLPRKWTDPNIERRREMLRKKARLAED